MDNQEAYGKQRPKAFPFPGLQASSILAQVSPATPSPRPPRLNPLALGKQGGAWGGEQEHASLEEPINCPGARQHFYSLLCV